ncbi:unnamed protein product, partial [Pylaiella littoralis]
MRTGGRRTQRTGARARAHGGHNTCLAWTSKLQRLHALRYHYVIIQGNTFNTNQKERAMRENGRLNEDTDSGDDCCFGDVGFMFDNALAKTRRSFHFGDISVDVRLVDDDPGAVQSGHYVWPAAPALSAYLVDRQQALLPRGRGRRRGGNGNGNGNGSRVLELGAGCGLAGLVAARLPTTAAVVFTDHDPGACVLDMIRESIAEQEQDTKLGGSEAARKCRCVPLSWGPVGKTQRASLADALSSVAAASSSSPSPRPNQRPAADGRGDGVASSEVYPGGTACTSTAAGGRVEEAARQPGRNEARGGTTRAEVGLGRHAGGGGDGGGGGGGGNTAGKGGGNTAGNGDRGGGGGDGSDARFDLVIASDVIYSVSVVEPLFKTVSDLLLLLPPCSLQSPSSPSLTERRSPGFGSQTTVATTTTAAAAAAEEDVDQIAAVKKSRAGRKDKNTAVPGGDAAAAAASPPTLPSQGRTDGSPVFFMSQSFGYDAETERAIDRECLRHGLVREIVWDELVISSTTTTPEGGQEQRQQQQQEQQSPSGQQQRPQPQPRKGGDVAPAEVTNNFAPLDGSSSGR